MPPCVLNWDLGCHSNQRPSADDWFDWPALPDLLPKSFPGVQTGRDRLLVDIDLNRLRQRIADYFDPELSHDEIAQRYPAAMRNSSAFRISDARKVRRRCLRAAAHLRRVSSATPIGPSTPLALLGGVDRRLLTKSAPTTGRTSFQGICGFPQLSACVKAHRSRRRVSSETLAHST